MVTDTPQADLSRPADETDASVIARSVEDPEHFEVLYDRYVRAIHRYASRRVGSDYADDVAAETFLLAFRARARYDLAARNALPWLYGIATNVLHSHRRKEQAQYRLWERTGVDPLVVEDHADGVVRQVTAPDRARRVSGVLARLSHKERDVLLLVAWGELSHEEVAEALRIPMGTVRSRLHRARGRLREVLNQPELSEDLA